ncbi:MAG TPA: hypothetical protein VGP88_00125, partial [Thermoplasmata archaeon]|nr:hypothetical protein [Thermoplasmata archaeon]
MSIRGTSPRSALVVAVVLAVVAGTALAAFSVGAHPNSREAGRVTSMVRPAGSFTSCNGTKFAHAVAAGGTITFGGNCNLQINATIVIGAALTVTIDGNGFSVVLLGHNDRLFTVKGGTLTIDGVSLEDGSVVGTNGLPGGSGGAGMDGFAGSAGSSGSSGTGQSGTGGTSGGAGTAGGAGFVGFAGGVARGAALWIQTGSMVTLTHDVFESNSVTGGNGGAGGSGGQGGSGGYGGQGGAGGSGSTGTSGGSGGDGGSGGSGAAGGP